jgi:hypothetical protein
MPVVFQVGCAEVEHFLELNVDPDAQCLLDGGDFTDNETGCLPMYLAHFGDDVDILKL